jgi:glycine/D-amino acid oxidase-like deaminating enzyme
MAGADDSYETAALPVLQEAGVRFEKLSASECARRWPQINFDGVSWSVLEPDSGFLAARRGCEAVLDAFLREGGQYRQAQATPGRITAHRMDGISVDTGEVLKADSYVFAPGPWLGRVFPFLTSSITLLARRSSSSVLPPAILGSPKNNSRLGWMEVSIRFLEYLETIGAGSRSLMTRAGL